jgi:hypothetical protein
MATIADRMPASGRSDDRFFLNGAFAMTLVVVAGFSLQLAMGRSSFGAPPIVHAHAIVFMGWIAIYLTQNILATTGNLALHRRLGWLAAAWMVPMLVLGCAVTAYDVRAGHAPFFFRPLQFLIFDPLGVATFAGLTVAAILLRRRTDWHRRLLFCGTALLLGAPFGRLLPMPLLAPWAWEIDTAVTLLFPLVGMAADLRRTGRIHPAWIWGVATIVMSAVLIEAITYSPVGMAIYRTVTAGSPGAAKPPLAFSPPPGPPPAHAPAAG